ncbi:hypothetical protein DQJ56_20275 [Salmonella enterica subsp. salamae serovar Sofia]|nr:hypothetical protein [Salmonella enterica subsp. salamae serovar Sofia]
MKNDRNDIVSIIGYIEKNIQRLSLSPKERLNEFLSCYFILDGKGVYKCKTITIDPHNGPLVEVPIINLLPVNIMEMKKATFSIAGERMKNEIIDPDKIKNNGDEIILNEEGNISFTIDFESVSPTETMMRFMEKNFNY